MSESKCSACGMTISSPREYHSFVACKLFQQTKNSRIVKMNILAVIEYGMKAQKEGLTTPEQAFNDFNLVLKEPF